MSAALCAESSGDVLSRPKNNSGLSGLFAYMIQQNHRALTRPGEPKIAVPLQDSVRHEGEGAWEEIREETKTAVSSNR